jgi:predicted transcriptional regulator of viral defense system
MNITELNLTELETKTLTTFVGCLYAEPGFSDVDVKDLSEVTGISTKSIRGALGSLVKKGVVTVNTNDGGYDIIDLNVRYWHLVNESWAEEADYILKK